MTEQPRDVWGSVVPVDVVGTDDRAPSARRSAAALLNGGAVVGVLAVVISVVMAAGIFAAASLSGGGPQPEDVMPGSSFAFAKIDLDPSADQKFAIRELASKFPKAPAEEADDLREELVKSMLEDTQSVLSYDRDVKPWLGSRIGFAGFRQGGSSTKLVVAIQTKDRGKADAAIRKATDGSGSGPAFDFRKGYVILTEDAQALDEALDAIDSGSLADDERFRSDVGRIGRDQIGLVWVDGDAMRSAFGDADMPDEMRGRSVVGIHAARRYVEIESVSVGSGTTMKGGPTDTLRRLPSNTAAAAYVHDLSQAAEQTEHALGLAGLAGGFYYPLFLGTTPDYDDDDYYACVSPADGPYCEPEEPEGNPTPFGGDYDKAGEIFTERIVPLLKDQVTFALDSFPKDEDAPYRAGVAAKVNGPGNAVEPFEDFLAALGVRVPVQIDGDVVYAATDKSYLDSLPRDGNLDGNDLFEDALGDLGDSVVAAAYVNLDAAEQAYDEYPEEADPLAAVGFSVTADGDVMTSRMRIVVR